MRVERSIKIIIKLRFMINSNVLFISILITFLVIHFTIIKDIKHKINTKKQYYKYKNIII